MRSLQGLVLGLALLATPPALAQDETPDTMLWKLIRNSADVTTLEEFVTQFPDSAHVPEARAKISALTDAGESFVPAEETLSPGELTLRVQRGLRLGGCDTGFIDGKWGPRAQRALESYANAVGPSVGSSPTAEVLDWLDGTMAVDCGEMPLPLAPASDFGRVSLEGTWGEEQTTRNSRGVQSTQRTRYIYRARIADGRVEDSVTIGINSPQQRTFAGTLGEPGRDSAGEAISWDYEGDRLVRIRDRETYWTKTYFMFYAVSDGYACHMENAIELKPGHTSVIARSQSSGAAIEVLEATPLSTTCDMQL